MTNEEAERIEELIKEILDHTTIWSEIKVKEGIFQIIYQEESEEKIINKLERVLLLWKIFEEYDEEKKKNECKSSV